MLDLRQLKTFVEVTKTKSLTLAGKNLNLTQPAISLQIKKLEERLDARLIVRRDRKFELTELGHVLYPVALGMLNLCNKAQHDIEQKKSEKISSVSIASSMFFAEHYLPEILKNFRQKFPKIQIRCFTGLTEAVEERVDEFECDVAFVAQTSNPNLIKRVIAEDELVLIVSPVHELAKRQSVNLEEVLNWPLISFSDGSGTQSVIDSLFAQRAINFEKLMIFSSTESVKRAVEVDCGIAFFPRKAVQRELALKTLVAVPVSDEKISRVYSFVFRKDIPLSSAAKAFRQVVLNTYRE